MRLLWQPGRACLNRSEQVSGLVRVFRIKFLVWFQTIMTDNLASGIRSVRDEDVQEPSQLSREELEMFRTQLKAMSLLAKVGVMPEFVFKFCFCIVFSCYQEQAG